MPLPVAEALVFALRLYAAVGALFAVAFSWRGAGALDPAAQAGSWGFRLLILPGSAALWPVLLVMWARAFALRRAAAGRRRDGGEAARAGRRR